MGISDEQIDRLAATSEEARTWHERGGFERERPDHTIVLPAFSIAAHPATIGDSRRFLEDGAYAESRFWTEAGRLWVADTSRDRPAPIRDTSPWTDDDRLPVVGVSWYEATAYCVWLSELAGRPVRLPSKAGNGRRRREGSTAVSTLWQVCSIRRTATPASAGGQPRSRISRVGARCTACAT